MTQIDNIRRQIEGMRKEIMALEAHMSTMSSSQTDWACERIDELAAAIHQLELELTRF